MRELFRSEPRRIAVFRALDGIGDFLCAVPALRALRRSFPDAEISLIGLPSARPFVERFSDYLDALIEFPGAPGLPERSFDPGATARFLVEMQGRPFDAVLQMHGSGLYSNPFVASLGATACAGFYLPGLYRPNPDFFFPYPYLEHEIHRHLLLLEALGIASDGDYIDWPSSEEDRREFGRLCDRVGIEPGSYACIHPGARDPRRKWGAESFARVAEALSERGLRVLITGAPSEAASCAAVGRAAGVDVVDLTGRTTLGGLAEALAGARIVVTNDTGVSHLAAAVFTPSIVVFITSDPARWAPLDRSLHLPIGDGLPDRDRQECREHPRCLLDGCTLPAREGRRRPAPPTAEQVIEAAEQLLRSEEMIAGPTRGETTAPGGDEGPSAVAVGE